MKQKVVVTGSTEGIGLAIARAFLEAGSQVVINSEVPDVDSRLMDELRLLGECDYVPSDLSSVEGARRLLRESHDRLGGLDCLVNNAGTFIESDFVETREEDFQKVMDLNVRGYFFASQEFARLVGPRDYDASIVCIASTNAVQGEVKHVSYDASKGAVLMMVRSMALDLAGQGIRVNAVGPGLIKTRLTDFGLQGDPELAERVLRQIPLGRMGETDDVSGAVLFLASPEARYITGQILYVDGGIMAQQMSY